MTNARDAAEKYRKGIEDRTWVMATHEHAERDFLAGAEWALKSEAVMNLVGALNMVREKTVTDPAHEVELRARAAFVYKIVVEALAAFEKAVK